jgi:hypothetical protein
MNHAELMNFIPTVLIAIGFLCAAPIVVMLAERTERHA